MKHIISLGFIFSLFLLINSNVFGQYHKLTVILLRHAEKDLTVEDAINPDLSPVGKQRANNLVKIINKYQPDAIYSTNYERTKATVRPLARKRRALTVIYDERNITAIKNLILSGKYKRLVIVGHNNTTPALVNMLLNENKYQSLNENEYDKIWIVKVKINRKKPNKVREKVITYSSAAEK